MDSTLGLVGSTLGLVDSTLGLGQNETEYEYRSWWLKYQGCIWEVMIKALHLSLIFGKEMSM